MAAGTHDNVIGIALPDGVVAHDPGVAKVWVDVGFRDTVAVHGATLGIDV